MNLFRRRSLPTKPPLVEPVRGGDSIVLDDEEVGVVRRGGAGIVKALDGYSFPTAFADTVNKHLVIDGLETVAKSRMQAGDFRGAATSCLKAIGIMGQEPSPWLTLAEVMLMYGDLARADGLIRQAERVAGKAGFGSRFKKESSQRVRDLVELRLVGLSGDEKFIGLIHAADTCVNIGQLANARESLALAEALAKESNSVSALERSGVIQRVRKRVARGS